MFMRFERVSGAAIFVLAVAGLASGVMAQTKPVPLINQPLVPDAVAPGGPAFILTVNGTGFVNKSVVEWNGGKRTTTVVSHFQLTATISARDIATAGTASVTVVNPAPTGGTSNVAFLSITNPTTTVGFRLASTAATGYYPVSVTAGDFNGDGKLDLAVPNYEDDTISILLGDGTGNFTLAYSPATGKFPRQAVVGDFNGDGKLDLAVGSGQASDDTVIVLLGDGTGNFTLGSSIVTGNYLASIAAGDFNGDGNLDVAVASAGTSGAVSILLGDGKGNLTLGSSLAMGNGATSIAVGDFNNDGKLDLAVANQDDNTVLIMLGDGAGNFTLASSPATGRQPGSVAVGDFNGDGNLDLAVANYGSHTVSILLGDGTGNFTLASSPVTGTYPSSVTVGDFNGDGKLDVADVANVTGTSGLSILLGDGTGNFTLASNSTSAYQPFSLAGGDFNGDGKMDFAVVDVGKDTVSILLQAPAVALSPGNLTFSTRNVGTKSTAKTVRVRNAGYAAVNISGVTISGNDPSDFSQTNNCPSSLATGASCMIEVIFSPVNGGSRTAALAISGDGGSSPSSVSLSGYGLSLILNPKTLNFGDVMVGQTSPPMSSTLTNIGPTEIAPTFILTDKTDYSFGDTCGSNIPPGGMCTITVIFAPKHTGQINRKIKIENEVDGVQKLNLSGTGT